MNIALDRPATKTITPLLEHLRARQNSIFLCLLLVGTLLKGVFWAELVFPFDAPDEPSHFNYIMQLRDYGSLPVVVMPSGISLSVPPSTPQDEQTLIMAESLGYTGFRTMPYETSQPPLFYVAAALLTAPFGENRLLLMYIARLTAVLFGVATIWAVWWAIRTLWPDQPLLVWGVPLCVTLQPQFTFTTSVINNDAAVVFIGAALLAVWAGGLKAASNIRTFRVWRWAVAAGIVTALSVLTKFTSLASLPCTMLWLWWLLSAETNKRQRVSGFVRAVAILGSTCLLLTGWWFIRNLQVYGDFSGTKAIMDLYVRQGFPLSGPADPSWQLHVATEGRLLHMIVQMTVSFWAMFSWMTLTLPPTIYVLIVALLICFVALAPRAWLRRNRQKADVVAVARQRLTLLSIFSFLAACLNLLYFQFTVDYQPQGRYLFIALAPAILVIALGLLNSSKRRQTREILFLILPLILLLMQISSIMLLWNNWQDLATQFLRV